MYEKTTLPNGLRIVTSDMPHTRSVCICVFIEVGSRYELPEQGGVSHFIEHMCFKGTERRPTAKEISETIDGAGGLLNGGTDKELTVYWAKVARTHFAVALDLLVDMIRNSKHDPADIENERKVIIEELNMSMDSPQNRVDMLSDEILWPAQALGRDVAGTKETVSSIDRTTILSCMAEHYLPSSTVIGVAGDIVHSEVVSAIADLLGDWPCGAPASWWPADNSQDAPRLTTEFRKTEQVHISLAVRGLPHNHPDRFILDVLNIILGEGMSSRLFLELRERLGLSYDIHSHTSHFHDSGAVNVCAGVHPSRVEDAMEGILAEMRGLTENAVPLAEITKAKELGKGRLMLRMEDTRSVAGWMAGQELLNRYMRTVDEVVSIIDSIVPEDVQRVATDLFQTTKLSLALVGPYRRQKRLERILKL